MKLDLSIDFDRKKAKTYFDKLMEEGARIEIKKHHNSRTLNQNSYLHACLKILCDYSGYAISEMKQILYGQIPFMSYSKGGHTFYNSSADLDKQQFADLIEWVREFGNSQGVYIPTSEEYLQSEFEIEKDLNHVK